MINEIDIVTKITHAYDEIVSLCKIEKIKVAHSKLVELQQWIHITLVNGNADKGTTAKIETINSIQEVDQFTIDQTIIETSIKSKQVQECIIKLLIEDGRIKRLRQEAQDIEELMKVMSMDYQSSGWTEISNTDGIHTMYRDNGQGMHSIRIDGMVESPIFDICSVIVETDLYATWIPRVTDCKLLANDNRYRKVIYCRANCPWPVDDRDVCLYGYGIDMLDDCGQVLVVSRSLQEGDCFDGLKIDYPPPAKGAVRAHTQIAGFTLKPISPTQTFVQVVSQTDPQMKMIPYWLLNFITNQFAHYLFVMLRRQTIKAKENKEFQSRIQSNPIYSEIREKAEKYFTKQQSTNSSNYEMTHQPISPNVSSVISDEEMDARIMKDIIQEYELNPSQHAGGADDSLDTSYTL